MATQGQRRREAVNAVRQTRQYYRKADTAGEKIERELDRLIKRKTLITVDDVAKVLQLVSDFIKLVEQLQRATAILVEILQSVGV